MFCKTPILDLFGGSFHKVTFKRTKIGTGTIIKVQGGSMLNQVFCRNYCIVLSKIDIYSFLSKSDTGIFAEYYKFALSSNIFIRDRDLIVFIKKLHEQSTVVW